MNSNRSIKRRLEVWKELLPSIGMAELYRLLSRLKRHAKIISCRTEDEGVAVIVRYHSVRDRISSRVLFSSWIGKRNYHSVRLPSYVGPRIRRKI